MKLNIKQDKTSMDLDLLTPLTPDVAGRGTIKKSKKRRTQFPKNNEICYPN